MNPYGQVGFFDFFKVAFLRLHLVFTGQWELLVTDELQCLTLICVGIACCLVGTFLIFQKKAMLANSISHTILLGIVLGLLTMRFILGQDLIFEQTFSLLFLAIAALIAAILTFYLTDLLIVKMRVQEDASIGIVFTFLFALGVFLVSMMSRNSHLGIEAISGNIDAVGLSDFKQALNVLTFSAVAIFLLKPILTLIAFDHQYAQVIGIKINGMNLFLMVLSALIMITGFKAVGVVVVLALFTTPVLIAHRFYQSISQILVFSSCLTVLASVLSVGLSRWILNDFHMPISTTGVLSLVVTLLFACSLSVEQLKVRFQKS